MRPRSIFEPRGGSDALRPFIGRLRSISHGLAPHRIDVLCVLALSLFGAALAPWAGDQFRQSGTRPKFYQEEFAPAVMFACGKGFHNVDWINHDPALSAFLLQGRGGLACGELASPPAAPRDSFQRISVYLELAVGLIWRVTGVSWAAVLWLDALLASLFAATVYGVMRLGMRPLVAAILSAVVVTSPLHLSYLPQLRDYSKAPFLLALVWLMGLAVKWPLTRRGFLWLAGVGGIVCGVGFGFRTDMLLSVPPFVAVLLIFRAESPGMRWRARFLEGAIASAVFMAVLALTAAPVLRGYARGGNIGHVILLGFSSPFNPSLGVEAKHYELSAHYDDMFQETVVRSYAGRVDGDTRLFSMGSDEYDRESSRYLLSVVRTFPADVAIRGVSAIAEILQAPFSPRYTHATGWVHSPLVRRIYDRRADALDRVPWLGWAASAAMIVGLAASQMRGAVFLLLLIVFLGGGAAIQFDPRHFFHLELIAWWSIGVMVDRAAAALQTRPRIVGASRSPRREWLAHAGVSVAKSAALVVVCALCTTVVLRTARHHQQLGLTRLFEQVLSAAGSPLSVRSVPTGAERVTLIPDLPELELARAAPRAGSVGTAYLLLDISPARCDSLNFFALAKYETNPGIDFTAPVTVSLADPQPGSSVKILLPVYSALYAGGQPARFGGFELARSHARCIDAIRKVGDLGPFPILVSAILGSDWRGASHYQTMTGVEDRQDGRPFQAQVYLTLPTLEIGRSLMAQPTTNPWPDSVATARVTTRAGAGAVVDGRPESGDAYLLQYRERPIQRGTCAVAGGELTVGGLTFGLLRNGVWYQFVNLVDRGRFIAAGCALEDGNYAIVLANNNPAGGVTKARLEKIGWVASASTVWAGR